MCGIAGRFHPVRLPPDTEWRQRADALLAHRGPDGSGYLKDDNCELVHRRLAIIDLSATGDQPMPNEDGTVQVVLNGEIYNYVELRRDLQTRGHRFRGTSDTEVLVHLYEEEGQALTDRLRGMFAFAIYDRRRRSLLLARDRYGIKPLYYAVLRDQVVFASEIKAVVTTAQFKKRIDRQACYDFLGLAYVPEPASGFEGLHTLPKGTTLLFDHSGEHQRTFHTLSGEPREEWTIDDAAAAAEESLLSAVQSQSRADVPVAALLSGGIDSSLVVAALCRMIDTPPTTFNVRFPDMGYDETEWALAVARRYGTRHQIIDLDERVLAPDSVIALLRHFDQPFADPSLIPTYAVCQAIRKSGIICTVSGDGGDEAFGGYAPFWRLNALKWIIGLPSPVRIALRRAGSALTPFTVDLGRQLTKVAQLAGMAHTDTSRLFAGLHNYLSEAEKEELVRPDARNGLLPSARLFGPYTPIAVTDLESLSARLTQTVFAASLSSDMLRKVDMMSMRASIEVRVPMLDEDVVACGLHLSHRLKTNGREGKLVLRRLARRWLPKEVAAHRKQGFSIPLDRMVGSSFHAMLSDILLSDGARVRSVLNAKLLDRWLGWFKEAGRGSRIGAISRTGLYQRVFLLLALEIWLRDHELGW